MSKRAQITIFIILGMMLLAGAAFLFYIVSEVTVTNLEVEQETSIAGLFQKEGLRLYVEDCIQDSLEEAIILVGQGGRIWYDTSLIDGTLGFSEDNNGILYSGNYYYLGLTNNLELEYFNSYPCDENETEDPTFCKYVYPESGDFGHIESLSLSNIESDLKKYLTNSTPECVSEFLNSNLSYSGDLGEGEIILSVGIESDGIDVDIQYPLELTVEGETYFHLTEFDYFYPSELKTFLSKAVTRPLALEQSDLDFNWTAEDFEDPTSDYYSSSYVTLSPTLIVTEVGESTEGLGHRVITYELEDDHILKNQPYSFSFAIANRPPALDFIERESCIDYDYIVIPGSADYGEVDFLVEAHDPDEDVISFNSYFDSSALNAYLDAKPTEIDYIYNVTAEIPADFSDPDVYTLTVNASDTHLLSDYQDVRVLVDMPIVLSIYIENAYASRHPEVNLSNGIPLLSKEDPFYLNIQIPEESVSVDVTQYATLSYSDEKTFGDFEVSFESYTGNYCFSLPWSNYHTNCDINDYSEDELILWPTLLTTEEYSYMNYSGAPGGFGIEGEFELEFTRDYCANFAPSPQDETQEVKVVECIPVVNDTHLYAYPYHEVTVEYDELTSEFYYVDDEEISPYFATHSCCNTGRSKTSANTYKDKGETCYEGEITCAGNIEGVTAGYIQEQAIDTCTGTRGNVCGDVINGVSSTLTYNLVNDELTCGEQGMDNCGYVATGCMGIDAWGDSTYDGGGICYGDMGCEEYCQDTLVLNYDGDDEHLFKDTYTAAGESLNALAESALADGTFDQSFLSFDCGCSLATKGHICTIDSGAGHVFDGTCQTDNSIGGYKCDTPPAADQYTGINIGNP